MLSKQRIAFVTNTSWSVYKFRLHLLQTLMDKGYEVYVLAPRDKYSAIFENLEGLTYIELKKLKSKSISVTDDVRLYKELKNHYKQIRPDLIFHYTIKANIYGSLAAAHHGFAAISVITGLGYMFSVDGFYKMIASRLYRYALKKTKEVWFLNHDDRQAFVDHALVKQEKTFLLPGEGVDSHAFYAAPYRQRGDTISFLLIARLIKHKGLYEFVEAARLLQQRQLSVSCNILGFFEKDSAVAVSQEEITRWEQEGVIKYLGATDNVIPFISEADCVVLPSYREGMPLSLLEGASMCKALIATDVPGCRDIVRHEQNGFLCRNKDAGDLAKKMETYCRLLPAAKTKMGEIGREIVLKEFTSEIVTGIYLAKLATFK